MDWNNVKDVVSGAKDIKDLEKKLVSAGVENPVEFLISASSAYAYNRAYRQRRNQSMKALRERVQELEAQL